MREKGKEEERREERAELWLRFVAGSGICLGMNDTTWFSLFNFFGYLLFVAHNMFPVKVVV